ncbi:replication endonuclease, partial [Yersinia enterocolitica]|nr:replication endonuclease [Yersinia enterocolitica]
MTSINNMRGRITPTPPLPYPGSGAAVPAYAYPGSKPRQTLAPARPLTREQLIQGQAVLANINNLPHFLRSQFISRYQYLLANKGLNDANKWLVFVFDQRIWPRIQVVNSKNVMRLSASMSFSIDAPTYASLAGMHDKELRRFARKIGDELMVAYNHHCDECIKANQGDRAVLLQADTQVRIFGDLARMARAFNITPMHWRKYLKGRL